jgi:hypothetical protein
MTERPILFSAPMVRALLDGTKTQTRRALKRQPWASCSIEDGNEGESPFVYSALHGAGPGHDVDESRTPCVCPYGQPGDRLWVREAWARTYVAQAGQEWIVYREGDSRTDYGGPWKPSIHMPRAASRILLEVTGVRIERLQDISEADAYAEGVEPEIVPVCCGEPHREDHGVLGVETYCCGSPIEDEKAVPAYRTLWESINGAGSWDVNPWVWVVEFRRIER